MAKKEKFWLILFIAFVASDLGGSAFLYAEGSEEAGSPRQEIGFNSDEMLAVIGGRFGASGSDFDKVSHVRSISEYASGLGATMTKNDVTEVLADVMRVDPGLRSSVGSAEALRSNYGIVLPNDSGGIAASIRDLTYSDLGMSRADVIVPPDSRNENPVQLGQSLRDSSSETDFLNSAGFAEVQDQAQDSILETVTETAGEAASAGAVADQAAKESVAKQNDPSASEEEKKQAQAKAAEAAEKARQTEEQAKQTVAKAVELGVEKGKIEKAVIQAAGEQAKVVETLIQQITETAVEVRQTTPEETETEPPPAEPVAPETPAEAVVPPTPPTAPDPTDQNLDEDTDLEDELSPS